jgi:Methyltransferase domain
MRGMRKPRNYLRRKMARLKRGIRRHRDRSALLAMLPKRAVGAEVGVWKGDFSARLLRRTKPTELHLIDPWTHTEAEGYEKAAFARRDADEMDAMYRDVRKRFDGRKNVVLHRLSSLDAVAELGSLDFAYIDGDHTYDAVLADLNAYWPLIRPGGCIAGDDYDIKGWWENGVTRAVEAFCAQESCERTVIGAQFCLRKPVADGSNAAR